MSRPLRIEFPDALHHVISRADRRVDTLMDDKDRKACCLQIADDFRVHFMTMGRLVRGGVGGRVS